MLDVKDKEQIKEIVREMLREDDQEKKLSLIERIVRVEEGIKNLSEQIKLIMDTTNKRFDRQTWLITAGFAFLSILLTLITIFVK